MPTTNERYQLLEAARVAYEPRYVRRLTAALYASIAPALAAADHGASPEVCAALVQAAPLKAVLEELYVRVGLAFAKAEYRALTRQRKAFAPFATVSNWAGRLKRFLTTEAPQRLGGMVQTTRDLVADTLVKATELGLGAKEAARLLRDQVASLTPGRAAAVAGAYAYYADEAHAVTIVYGINAPNGEPLDAVGEANIAHLVALPGAPAA